MSYYPKASGGAVTTGNESFMDQIPTAIPAYTTPAFVDRATSYQPFYVAPLTPSTLDTAADWTWAADNSITDDRSPNGTIYLVRRITQIPAGQTRSNWMQWETGIETDSYWTDLIWLTPDLNNIKLRYYFLGQTQAFQSRVTATKLK